MVKAPALCPTIAKSPALLELAVVGNEVEAKMNSYDVAQTDLKPLPGALWSAHLDECGLEDDNLDPIFAEDPVYARGRFYTHSLGPR